MAYRVVLTPFNRVFECGSEETILEAGLRNGVNVHFGCRHGGCGTCKARVVEGEVNLKDSSSFALMDFEREEGFCLLCSSVPLGDVTIEVHDYTEEDLFGSSG